MRNLLLPAGLALFAAACDPVIPQVAAPATVVVRFDPSQTPAVVPSPNDLATNPKTGLLAVPAPANATDADLEFIAYLNTLDGFPVGSSATATFDGALKGSDSDLSAAVTVLDLDDGNKPVTGYAVSYQDTPHEVAASRLSITPGGAGWTPGHHYAVALFGGEAGLKGADGQTVVGSSTWALLRSTRSLVTCENLASPDCKSATELIPSAKTDPAARVADQAQKAVQLEGLRRKYAPVIEAFVTHGANRADIALAWTFKASTRTTMGFNPAANPPVLPVPTDLAMDPVTGLVNAPSDAGTAAQQEFTRDYLNTLDGFPVSATGQAVVVNGDLDPVTVGPSSVVLIDLNPPEDGGAAPAATVAYDATTHLVSVTPPASGWPKAAHYAVAVVSKAEGVNGVQATGGKPVVASDVFALVRSASPLVTCENLSSPNCTLAIQMAPLKLEQAKRLEQIRRGFAPILDQLEVDGVRRPNVALLWTFKVVSQGEATFSPADNVIPFPNNLLLTGGGKVSLPVDLGASPTKQAIIAGLNTLDGFSLTGTIISENSDELGALDLGAIDEATLADGGTGFVKMGPGGPSPVATVSACLGCRSSLLPDGGPQEGPQQLQFVPEVPLDEKSTYASYLTTNIKDTGGKPIMASPTFALLRMQSALVDAGGKSQVSGVSDAQAGQLEPARLKLKTLIDALVASGQKRSELALAWAFTTQSVHTTLKALNAAPAQAGLVGLLPAVPDYVVDVTAEKPAALAHVGKLFAGRMPALFMLTGPGGTLNPTGPQVRRVPFMVTLPTGAAPAGGFPVVIFGHGLTGARTNMLYIAEAFATAGLATIATDVVWHGDRSVCTGSKAATGQASDDASCANPATQMCDAATGRCVGRGAAIACDPATAGLGDVACGTAGLGACVPDAAPATTWHCEGGDFKRDGAGTPLISGWNMLDLKNLFATRDNFRQQVVDLSQLARVIADTSTTSLNAKLALAGAAGGLDATKVHYAGQSLGGFLGTLFNSVSPVTHHVLLNVAGADWVNALLVSPAFSAQRAGFLGFLASEGVTPGTPGFDAFIVIARWILDPADPQNVAYQLTHGATLPADRAVLIQYIKDDFVVPNSSTDELVAAANREGDAKQCLVRMVSPTFAELGPAARHGFLLNFANPTVTAAAQSQAVTFLTTGSVP